MKHAAWGGSFPVLASFHCVGIADAHSGKWRGRQNSGRAAQDSRIAIAADAGEAKSAETVRYAQGRALGTTVSRRAPIPDGNRPVFRRSR